MKASIRASWMVESGPAVMKNATSKASTTARASRLCARPGDKFERMKCCSSGTTAVVFTIGATLCSGWSARNEAYPLSRFSHHAARLVVSTILPPVAAGERGSHMSLLGHSETIWLRPAHRRFTPNCGLTKCNAATALSCHNPTFRGGLPQHGRCRLGRSMTIADSLCSKPARHDRIRPRCPDL
jgi:hypothetical protein